MLVELYGEGLAANCQLLKKFLRIKGRKNTSKVEIKIWLFLQKFIINSNFLSSFSFVLYWTKAVQSYTYRVTPDLGGVAQLSMNSLTKSFQVQLQSFCRSAPFPIQNDGLRR